MKSFYIQAPIRGVEILLVEAESLEEALAIVRHKDFDNGDPDSEEGAKHAGMSLQGTVWRNAQPADEDQIKAMKECFGDD